MIEIARYDAQMCHAWDDLVAGARNGTVLHLRGFMDYHSDRFDDHSLVALRDGALLAVLPANRDGDTLWSHIYHRYPAEDDLYALWRCGGRLLECNISTTIDLSRRLPLDRGCRSAANAARRAGVEVRRSNDWAGYWQMLGQVLGERHDARPVHTLAEIQLLVGRFPDRIRLYTATTQGCLVAGVVIFELNDVAHCQYIAASSQGRELKALTLLLDYLIGLYAEREFHYFDFGTSNEEHGARLNRGLVQQKCRLGGRGILYPIYEVDVRL